MVLVESCTCPNDQQLGLGRFGGKVRPPQRSTTPHPERDPLAAKRNDSLHHLVRASLRDLNNAALRLGSLHPPHHAIASSRQPDANPDG